ncbi:hypothetical protein BDP27DRAFT_1311444 [Rhodocollybia butyracea]|uniref:Nucleic acid-binding protein n=1 Tax=Rhodocollybia butyracea TaxID=206335 RepID=A0A9P5QB12_9AGAR|nr:hypothetical protein BDP27DRAFT_1311444 [Rhodocollybia butyracea]
MNFLTRLHRFIPRLSRKSMSFEASVSKLPLPVKDLVASATKENLSLTGTNEKDQAEVVQWIEKVGQGDVVKQSNFKDLNSVLVPRTYIATNYLTAADYALYGALHPVIVKMQAAEYHSHPSITRYFDHIQSIPAVRKTADTFSSFSVINFDLVNAPKVDRTPEPPKKKEKPAEPAPSDSAATPAAEPAAATKGAADEEGKVQKKEKKEKKEKPATDAAKDGKKEGKKAGGGKAAPAADEGEPVPSMIDLRVGHIIDVQKHPDADGLYIEQIDIGEETGPRTVVSGLVHYIPIEQMRDKYLVAVCNLKPANMRGVKSFAMVLCASSKDGKEAGIELIQPPPNSKPGDRIYFEGADFENATPLAQLNPKKKIFETVQPGFITLENREAAWVNPATGSVHKIRTKDGICVAPTLVGASLS